MRDDLDPPCLRGSSADRAGDSSEYQVSHNACSISWIAGSRERRQHVYKDQSGETRMLRHGTEADCNFRLEVRDWLARNLDPSSQDLPHTPRAGGDAHVTNERVQSGD
jgi:hypothetical protein